MGSWAFPWPFWDFSCCWIPGREGGHYPGCRREMGLLRGNRAEKTVFRTRGFMEPLRTSIPIIRFSGNYNLTRRGWVKPQLFWDEDLGLPTCWDAVEGKVNIKEIMKEGNHGYQLWPHDRLQKRKIAAVLILFFVFPNWFPSPTLPPFPLLYLKNTRVANLPPGRTLAMTSPVIIQCLMTPVCPVFEMRFSHSNEEQN